MTEDIVVNSEKTSPYEMRGLMVGLRYAASGISYTSTANMKY